MLNHLVWNLLKLDIGLAKTGEGPPNGIGFPRYIKSDNGGMVRPMPILPCIFRHLQVILEGIDCRKGLNKALQYISFIFLSGRSRGPDKIPQKSPPFMQDLFSLGNDSNRCWRQCLLLPPNTPDTL